MLKDVFVLSHSLLSLPQLSHTSLGLCVYLSTLSANSSSSSSKNFIGCRIATFLQHGTGYWAVFSRAFFDFLVDVVVSLRERVDLAADARRTSNDGGACS